MARPLEGTRVLDFSWLLPGPFATLLLADLGANVVKIESPRGGDYARYYPPMGREMSALFAVLNRDKRSVAINLKEPRGQRLVERLVADADVLVESFRPGVLAKLGLGASALEAINPRLIYCSITGYGQTGPLAHRAGHDIDYLAMAGLLGLTGHDGEVIQPGVQIADIAGGSLYAVTGILAALFERERTGRGRVIDASMTDGAAGFALIQHAREHLGNPEQGPGEDDLAGGLICYRPWRCADGGWLAVGALEPKFWERLCDAIGHPEFATDGLAQGKRRLEVGRRLAEVFASRSREEWIDTLRAHDVCVEPSLSLAEVRQSAHARHRGLFGTSAHPTDGAQFLHQYPNPRLLVGAEPPETPRPAPRLGEHTAEVLKEVGVEVDALRHLVRDGVVVARGDGESA